MVARAPEGKEKGGLGTGAQSDWRATARGWSCTSRFVAWPNSSGSEKSVYRWDAWIRKETQPVSSRTFQMDHERCRYSTNLGYISLEARTTESLIDYHLLQNNYSFDALQAYCFGIHLKL